MIKVGICDDEEDFIQELKEYISDYSWKNSVEIEIQSYENADDLLLYIKENGALDIVFLDIQLKGTTGVEVGKRIRSDLTNEMMQIVFVSSKQGYAIQLFDIRPMNFLIKPIDYQKTKYIFDEYLKRYYLQEQMFEYQIGEKFYQVHEEKILYFQSRGKKVYIITQNEKDAFYGKLSDVLLQLKDNSFCLVHKSYLINMRYATEYGKDYIVMANGEKIPVSSKMKNALNRKLMETI